jgi:hypothetical protein
MSRLERDVASGEVTKVRSAGGLWSEATGFSVVEVHWRRGIFGYSTKVIEARPLSAASAGARDGVTGVIGEDLGDRLAASQPDVQVVRVARWTGMSTELFGLRVAGWMAWALLIYFVTILWLLVRGPEPWRATRWAWFWLMTLAAPLGMLAFLLLAGPTSVVSPPRPGSRRLTGGWAFLILLLARSALEGSR